MSDLQNDDQPDNIRTSLRLWRSKSSKIPVLQKSVSELAVIPDLDEEYYRMTHKNRGLALIFNHLNFDRFAPRDGTNKDCAKVKKTLEKLRFDTVVYKDLKSSSIEEELSKVSEMNHSESDCLVVVVMTHGDENNLHARDESYPLSVLWKPFTGNNCKSLAGKPKLYFIQACRGTNTDQGVECQIEYDNSPQDTPVTIKIPIMADFMFMYSTPLGNYSFRNPSTGSWFIQTLCDQLNKRATTEDLYKILVCVNRNLTRKISKAPKKKELDNKKQVGQIVSSLTRLVHF